MPKADAIDEKTLEENAVETNDDDDVDDLRAQLEALNSKCASRRDHIAMAQGVPFQPVRGPGQRARLRTGNERVCQNIYLKSAPMWPHPRPALPR